MLRSSEKTLNATRTSEVAHEPRKDATGDRFAKWSSPSKSGGGELWQGVTSTMGERSERGEVVPK